ncbi:MAG: TIGR02996 domain-containing protein [Planctomycetes bacterium]|nr:TIGR02996 domain-containing protein [Planctomycetota bacterium]
MNDRDALLRAILVQPDDDTARLVYADWLDEYGDPDDRLRAEQIRVQVEFAAALGDGLPWRHPTLADVTGTVRRGFVAEIDLPTDLYLDRGAELFRTYPITTVHLAGRAPFRVDTSTDRPDRVFLWSFGSDPTLPGGCQLPESFREPLTRHPLGRRFARGGDRERVACGFGSPGLAWLAASEVAVDLARRLNDLPPLPPTRAPDAGPGPGTV